RAADLLDDCRWDQRRWEWGHFRRAALLVHSLEDHTSWLNDVCFSPDGRRLATASNDGTGKVWDAATGKEQLTLKGHTGPVGCVCCDAEGKRVASGSVDKTVRLWDAATGQETATLAGHTSTIHCVCFSPDGRQLASASSDDSVRVWDAAGKETAVLKGHASF